MTWFFVLFICAIVLGLLALTVRLMDLMERD